MTQYKKISWQYKKSEFKEEIIKFKIPLEKDILIQSNKVEEMLILKNYSPNTISAYRANLKKYFNYKGDNLEVYSEDNIKKFLIKLTGGSVYI